MPRVSVSGAEDPNSDQKDRREREIAEFFGTGFEEQYDDYLDWVDRNNPALPESSFWQRWGSFFMTFLVPILGSMAMDSAAMEAELFEIDLDMAFIESQASNWASSYAFSLVTDINEVTRVGLQNALDRYFIDKDFADYLASIEKMLSPVRSEMIAVTEVTRGYSRGLAIYKEQLERQGVYTDTVWHTEGDGAVCVICRPNDGKLKVADGWTVPETPAHPRCRCWEDLVKITKSIILEIGGTTDAEKIYKYSQGIVTG